MSIPDSGLVPSFNEDHKYYELLEFAPDAFFHGDATGNFLLVNSKAVALTGYTKQELLGMNMRDLFSDSQLNHRPLRYDLLNSGKTVIVEREIITKSNEIRRIEMSSKKNADGTYQSFIRDITDKIRQEMAYHEMEQRYHLAFHTSPDAITINDINGIYIDVNKGFCEITGYDHDEIIGKNSIELGIWVDPEARRQVIETLKRDGVVKNFEAEFRRKDGSTTTALMSSNFIEIDGSLHMLAVTKEITHQKVVEHELRLAKEEAEQNDRLKSAFLANLSHEIRTPMNGILGFTELLRFPDNDEATRLDYIEIIHKSGQHLLGVINDIIEIAKIETNQIEPNIAPTDIALLLKDIEQQCKLSEQQSGHLKLQFQNTPLVLHTDATKLRQILINLISNAIKFTDKGQVEVCYQRESGNRVSFYVKDTGIGIPEEFQHLVFERFRQVPNDRNISIGGSGLGLSISKAYVEILEGWIGLKSTPGIGTTFHFTIRDFAHQEEAKQDAPALQQTDTAPSPSTHQHGRNGSFEVLVVEDNDVNYLLLSKLLTNWGYGHIRAVTGTEAIKLALDDNIRLILMDIRIPGINGVEAVTEIRKKRCNLPVIAQTAHALQEEIEDFYRAGFDAYITKPIDHSTLLRTIQSLI